MRASPIQQAYYRNILCPAKVNLILRVGPRRRDGFHDIETLMVPLDWGDRLDLKVAQTAQSDPSIRLSCPQLKDVPFERNLVVRAARAFMEAFGCSLNLEIKLKKVVPTGGGLGGGSSDAATVLSLLAAFCLKAGFIDALGLQSKLQRLAGQLGSDVAFFLDSEPAWCSGRGEICRPVSLPSFWMVVLLPTVSVSTPAAYGSLDRMRAEKGWKPSKTWQRRPPWLTDKVEAGLIPRLENDFEEVVVANEPGLRKMRSWLAYSGATAARMSGSGSTFFGLYPSKKDAEYGVKFLRKQGLNAVATRSLGR